MYSERINKQYILRNYNRNKYYFQRSQNKAILKQWFSRDKCSAERKKNNKSKCTYFNVSLLVLKATKHFEQLLTEIFREKYWSYIQLNINRFIKRKEIEEQKCAENWEKNIFDSFTDIAWSSVFITIYEGSLHLVDLCDIFVFLV